MERFLVRETSGNFSSITASKRLAQALWRNMGQKHDDSTLESREISTLHEKILNVRWWWWRFSRFFFDVFHSLSFVWFSNGDAALIFSSSSHLSCSHFFSLSTCRGINSKYFLRLIHFKTRLIFSLYFLFWYMLFSLYSLPCLSHLRTLAQPQHHPRTRQSRRKKREKKKSSKMTDCRWENLWISLISDKRFLFIKWINFTYTTTRVTLEMASSEMNKHWEQVETSAAALLAAVIPNETMT